MILRSGRNTKRYAKKYSGVLPCYLNCDGEWNKRVYKCSNTRKFDKLLRKINADVRIPPAEKEKVLDLLLIDMEDAGHNQVDYYKTIRGFAKKGLEYDTFDDGWGMPFIDFSTGETIVDMNELKELEPGFKELEKEKWVPIKDFVAK